MTTSRSARYTPWWLPLALVLSLALCCALFVALIWQRAHGDTQTAHTNAAGEPLYRWRMVTTWPKGFPGIGLAANNFAARVEEMSGGRLVVQVYGAGEIVPAMGVFDAVSSGTVEMGHSAAYYWKGKTAAAVFFASVPFGMTAQELNAWLHYGGGMELWRELYAPFNLIPFAGGNTGVQMGGWFNREINSVADLQGLKMRIPGLGGEVFTRAGGTSVNIPGGELYTSLQTGVIDATEWVGPYNDLAFGFQQIANYYYYPGWQEPGPSLEFIVNSQAYARLPPDLQAIVATAARAINQDMLDEYTARSQSALTELVERHRVELRSFPKDVTERLKQMAEAIYQEEAAKDANFARVYQAYKTFLEQVRPYTRLTEEAYAEIR